MRYFGKLGFAITEETAPGIWEPKFSERDVYGDVNNLSQRQQANQNSTNDDLVLSCEFSIITDAFIEENFQNIKYITYLNSKWKVTSVKVARPRLILTPGGIYNG